ncbi:MAG: tRNA (adenosine(37)-N6)-threonylcarbamoyltransferase complex ATPase subunit type 1 TsaE [Acidocella sp. 20-63-7]|nr:MAG: tRNA (adenosine(37)-N6)-threonylcarbamoyltransferase complex ATPase subunit type 1 TsaE [Acidocella sp. 20-63-7]
MHLHLENEAATAALAEKLASRARPGDVVLLSGPLGAGKSSFARAFIRALAGDPGLVVPSPTFTLVQSYELSGVSVWHYDLWRLSGPESLEELGWEEAQEGIVLVEWPERLGDLAPAHALRIALSHAPPGREIILENEGKWFDAP